MAPELERQLAAYHPCCEQEAVDRDVMLHFLRENTDAFTRENLVAHFTASSWIVNSSRTHALMAWHNLYRAWSWTGGHADGETDLLSVALREAREETGLVHVAPVFPEIFSLETLWVEGHEKRGKYVPCHLHLNVTYLTQETRCGQSPTRTAACAGSCWTKPWRPPPRNGCAPACTKS